MSTYPPIRKELSWTPVRRGLIYCSSACGFGCKITDFDAAGLKAKALAERLGPGWKPYVHENLGWHYAAVNGDLHMSEYDSRSVHFKDGYGKLWYSVTTGTMYSSSGNTPQEALRNLLPGIEEEATKLANLRDAILASLNE